MRRREEADAGISTRGMPTRLLRTLASSPADRAWCRHGLVVLCKARLGQEGIGAILDRLVTMAEEELFESSWGSKEGEHVMVPSLLSQPLDDPCACPHLQRSKNACTRGHRLERLACTVALEDARGFVNHFFPCLEGDEHTSIEHAS